MLDIDWHKLCFIAVLALDLVKVLTGTLLDCADGTEYCATINSCETRLRCFLVEYDLAIDCISHKHLRRHLGIRKKDWKRICNYLPMWTKSVCSQHETSCDHNTRCFSAEETCDGMTKCADGADEKDCKVCRLGEQKCDLGRNCFSVIETCDGVWKCADGMDEENCNQRNCSASMFCNPRYNCTGKDSRQNCSTLNLDGIQLSYEERAGLLGAITFCLLVVILICMACCCKCCCCSCCMDGKHPKPVSDLNSQLRHEGNSSDILQLRTGDAYVDPSAINSESRPLSSQIYSYHDGQQLQPTSVLLQMVDYRGVPPISPRSHLPPVRFPGPYFDPELPSYESLFPDRHYVNVGRNRSYEKT